MNEATLRKQLKDCLEREFPMAVVFSLEDKFTAGVLDTPFIYSGKNYQGTTWLELKHVTPKKPFKSSGLQQANAIRMAEHGQCWYIVYEERKIGEEIGGDPIFSLTTYIIHPKLCREFRKGDAGTGFNHYFVAEFLRSIYG